MMFLRIWPFSCNGKASRFVLEQFHEWYRVWPTHRCKSHMAEYWDMRHINGSILNQSEPVMPEVTNIDFGIDNTELTRRIRSRLELVRQVEM